jgi:hypothetical protein
VDPDKQGDIVWQYRAGKGSARGIMWGAAADGDQVYFPSPTAAVEQGGLRAWLATGARVSPAPAPKCGARHCGCGGAQSAALRRRASCSRRRRRRDPRVLDEGWLDRVGVRYEPQFS